MGKSARCRARARFGWAACLGRSSARGITPFTRETHTLSDLASAEFAQREDRWAPVAADVSSWCADATMALDGVAPVPMIKGGRDVAEGATDDIRNERLAPLAEQARRIWRMLRQESNVDLAGSATQRRVELDVSVDGTLPPCWAS
jgi:hypothetical protein